MRDGSGISQTLLRVLGQSELAHLDRGIDRGFVENETVGIFFSFLSSLQLFTSYYAL